MTTIVTCDPVVPATVPPPPTVKAKQQAMWASGDFAVIGTTLQIVGEQLCEAADVCAGECVLDVAAGNGNATLAAARRFAGVMFAPDHAQAARELMRVCRPGGRIGLASWTPTGFLGHLFRVVAKHVPPIPGVVSPLLWGTDAHLRQLFAGATRIDHTVRHFAFRYTSPQHFVDVFRTYYGPTHKAFASLDVERQAALQADMLALLTESDRGGAAGLVVAGEYLETVITR